jgi:hypothetical protein
LNTTAFPTHYGRDSAKAKLMTTCSLSERVARLLNFRLIHAEVTTEAVANELTEDNVQHDGEPTSLELGQHNNAVANNYQLLFPRSHDN